MDQVPEEYRSQLRQQLETVRATLDKTTEIRLEAEDVRINTGVPEQHF